MTAIVPSGASGLQARRAAMVALILAVAGVLLFAAYDRAILPGGISGAVRDGVNHTTEGFNSVTAMLAGRSPGERLAGSLATLKPVRKAALHERALPKVQLPGPPVFPAIILGALPVLPVDAISPVPAYSLLSGIPQGQTIVGPPNELVMSPPGSPVIVPPVTTPSTPVIPGTPVSAVPEPSSWIMLLMGFAAIARVIRPRRVRPNAALH